MNLISLCNKIINLCFKILFLLVPLIFSSYTYEMFEFNKLWLVFGVYGESEKNPTIFLKV